MSVTSMNFHLTGRFVCYYLLHPDTSAKPQYANTNDWLQLALKTRQEHYAYDVTLKERSKTKKI